MSGILQSFIILVLFIALSSCQTSPNKLLIKSAVCGGKHSLLLDSQSKVFAFGSNQAGQLGDGTLADKSQPVAVSTSGILSGKTIVAISAGNQHSLALPQEGNAIYAWGSNDFGQLGIDNNDGTNSQSSVPVQVKFSAETGFAQNKKIVMISSGFNFNVALDSDGILYSWGANDVNQLGDGTSVTRMSPVRVNTTLVTAGKKIVAISCGNSHSLAVDEDGNVFGWGENYTGDLGDGGNVNREYLQPVSFSTPKPRIVGISAGSFISFAWDNNGAAYSWGFGVFGGLGDGSLTTKYVPNPILSSGALSGKKITSISGKYGYALALDSNSGELFSWGYNLNGQLGDGTRDDKNYPVAVKKTGALSGKKIVSIAAGGLSHSLAIDSDGAIYSFGKNYNGELGVAPSDTYSEMNEPYKVLHLCKNGFVGENCEYPVCFGNSEITGTSKVCSAHGKCTAPDTCTCNSFLDWGNNCENSLFENLSKSFEFLSPNNILNFFGFGPAMGPFLIVFVLVVLFSCCCVCGCCLMFLVFCGLGSVTLLLALLCSVGCMGFGCCSSVVTICSQCCLVCQRRSIHRKAEKEKNEDKNSLLMSLTTAAIQNQDDD